MASSRKSQTKVGTLACFAFFKRMSYVKNRAMLFHVDMVQFAKQAKRNIYMSINDIHFKYIWDGGRDLILPSVAHLRKKAVLKVVGSWR